MYAWRIISNEYLDFIRKAERKVPYTDYGDSKYKPFFGVLFETNMFSYVTQISSPKPRHLDMPENVDFYKIYHPKYNTLMTIVNLNYMFPVVKSELIDLDYRNMHMMKKFENVEQKSKYIHFLKIQLREINKVDLSTPALKIYENRYNDRWETINRRCLDFKLLEEKALEYCKIHNIEISGSSDDKGRKSLDEQLQEAKEKMASDNQMCYKDIDKVDKQKDPEHDPIK